MSQTHEPQWKSYAFVNPLRRMFPKTSNLSPKLLSLLSSFEQTLAECLRKLKPVNTSDVLSLSWMRLAMGSLSGIHANVNTLTTALQLPVGNWDEKWMDLYLTDSVKLLDICNGLTSELSRVEQSQLLLKYALHILASAGTTPSSKDINRVHSSLDDWMEKIYCRSLKLENCSSILQELATTLHLVKVKHSARGEVLMRALYGVKVVTIFVCSVFTAAMSGCAKPLTDLHVSGDFLWADAFNDLQATVNGEIKSVFSLGKSGVLKEFEAVKAHAVKLHNFSIDGQMKTEQPSIKEMAKKGEDIERWKQSIDGQTKAEQPSIEEEPTKGENIEGWKQSAADLASSAECFACELELLLKQIEEFFQFVLSGRNALLCSLTTPNVQLKGKGDKFR